MPPGNINPSTIQWGGKRGTEAAGDAARVEGTQASTESTRVDLQTKGAQNEATLANTRQGMSIAQQQAADRLRDAYRTSKAYITYEIAAPALSTALYTAPNPMGDVALTYAAAKLFDPDSAVRDQEQRMLGNASNYLDNAIQEIKRQFKFDDNSGTFTDENRALLRAELLRRGDGLRLNYERVRRETEGTATRRGYNLADVTGEHINAPFEKKVEDYLREHDVEEEGVQRPADATTDQIAGEPIKGYRLSGGAEQQLTDYLRSPDATPEGYAQMFADLSVSEGHIPETDRAAVMRANIEPISAYLKEFSTPEQRAKIPAGLDYSEIDRLAQENAGAGDVLAQAARNIPESAVQLAEGTIAPVKDAITSIAAGERQGMYKVLPDVGAELAGKAFSDAPTPTTDAMLQVLGERYGGGQELTNTLTTDPVGLFADAAGLVSGGASLARNAGKYGSALAETARALDPAQAGANLARLGQRTGRGILNLTPGGSRRAVSETAALPSGVGGRALEEAFGAGRQRGQLGPPTPGAPLRPPEAFTQNMRDPQGNATAALTAAQEALTNLRQQGRADYLRDIQSLGQNPTQLDINAVRQRIDSVKPESFDTWATRDGPRPSDHLAWQQMRDAVEHYAAEAVNNPSLLEPLAMDKFKQDLYDIGSRIGGAYDRDAARIASAAYNGVKDLLTSHDPTYARTMANYEQFAGEVRQLEDTFSLGAARGKDVNIDTAMRKLLSSMRNNANTNFGQRENLATRLSALDPSGTLLPTLAGQSVGTWKPRGLQSLGGTVVGGIGLGAGASVPTVLAGAPLFSPRIMGELAYGAGRGLGTVERGLDLAKPYVRSALDAMPTDAWKPYGVAAAGNRSEEVEQQMGAPELPPGLPAAAPEGIKVDPVTGDIILPDGRRVPKEVFEKLQAVQTFARGGAVQLDRLARRYAGGGPVRSPFDVPSSLRVPEWVPGQALGPPADPAHPPKRRPPPPPPPPQRTILNTLADIGQGGIDAAGNALDFGRAALPYFAGATLESMQKGTPGMAIPMRALDMYASGGYEGPEPTTQDYVDTLMSAGEQFPQSVEDLPGIVTKYGPMAYDASREYFRNNDMEDIGEDIAWLDQKAFELGTENPREAIKMTTGMVPYVGDVLSLKWAAQDAARLRAQGTPESIAEAERIEKWLALSTLASGSDMVVPFAGKGAKAGIRGVRALGRLGR